MRLSEEGLSKLVAPHDQTPTDSGGAASSSSHPRGEAVDKEVELLDPEIIKDKDGTLFKTD